MVRAWIADVTPLYEEECYKKYYEGIPDFRKKKADVLRDIRTKAQSVGVWSLWQKIRAEYDLPEFSAFNLSHSGTYVMCAVSTEPSVRVGCDLEQIGRIRLDIAKRFFCTSEYDTIISAGTEEEQTNRFFRYWVLKESFMKATGKGMALPMNTFCIHLGEPPVLLKKPDEFHEPYYYMEFSVVGLSYKMAVCSTDKKIDTKIHMEFRL